MSNINIRHIDINSDVHDTLENVTNNIKNDIKIHNESLENCPLVAFIHSFAIGKKYHAAIILHKEQLKNSDTEQFFSKEDIIFIDTEINYLRKHVTLT